MTRPWSKLWHSQWASDLRHRACTASERGVFWTLYLLAHQDSGRIPLDDAAIAGAAGVDIDELRSAVRRLEGLGMVRRLRPCGLELPDLAKELGLSSVRAQAARSRWSGAPQKTERGRARSGILHEQNHDAPSGSGSTSSSSLSLRDGEPERKGRGGTPSTHLWDRLWLEHRGAKFEWIQADLTAIAKATKLAGGDLAELERRTVRLLTSSDLWLAQNASPRILHSRWNQLAVEFRPLSKAEKNSIPTAKSKAIVDLYRNIQ